MDRNKVKITCNPYSKQIEYKRWGVDSEDRLFKWLDLGSKSQLVIDPKFTHATIQHNACEIVEELSDEYNRGNVGLDIVFEGTDEDYEDLKDIVEQFFGEKGIECVRGDLYIDSAEVLMPEIQEVFVNLTNIFSEYSSEKIKKILSKYLDATQTIIPICVVGMYSTGKSAFINSLIGEEILPSAVNPTTARNYKIVESSKIGKIKFLNCKECIEIEFEDERYNIVGNLDKELRIKITDKLEHSNIKSMARNIYVALTVINEYADKSGKVGEFIEIEVPFYDGPLKSDNYKFVIFDTPGSDSESHEEHLKVLKNALGEQTNGLPILLTSPKDMDRTGADALLNVVNGIDGNLDLTNAMIIVNQADGVSARSLEKVKNDANTILSQWKSNRLYFLSAIMGLGSKKVDYMVEDAWVDDDYLEIFLKNVDAFSKIGDRLYKQLYKHNQIAVNRQEKYVASVNAVADERELIYVNSGLHCIEKEIVEFARKFAMYNKCAQAQDYLDEAIAKTAEIMAEKEREKKQIEEKIKREQETTKKSLLEKLNERISTLADQYKQEYPEKVNSFVVSCLGKYKKQLETAVSETWKSVETKDKKSRVSYFLNGMKGSYLNIQRGLSVEISQYSKEYWDKKRKLLQDECCKLIKEAESLSAEERSFLQQFIMNLELPRYQEEKINISEEDVSKYFLIFRLNNVNQSKTKELFGDNLSSFSRRITAKIKEEHGNGFDSWNKRLEDGLVQKISSFNPRLRAYSQQLERLQSEMEELQQQEYEIKENQNKINAMFVLKERK